MRTGRHLSWTRAEQLDAPETHLRRKMAQAVDGLAAPVASPDHALAV